MRRSAFGMPLTDYRNPFSPVQKLPASDQTAPVCSVPPESALPAAFVSAVPQKDFLPECRHSVFFGCSGYIFSAVLHRPQSWIPV